jgi:hypothetical protein
MVLSGDPIRDKLTVIYVPYHYHYSPSFRIWATSKEIEWDKANQLIYWYPSPHESKNQIVFGTSEKLEIDELPKNWFPS